MNDSKWRRLLEAIAHLPLPSSYWRFLGDEREFEMPTPRPSMVVERAGSCGIGDYGATGPFFFRDVETVRWPASFERNWSPGYAPVVIEQPLVQLAAALDWAGEFDYSRDEDKLVLFAYRRAKDATRAS